MLIIGGAENKGEEEAKDKQTPADFIRLEVLKLIELTGKTQPVIEVITTVTSDAKETFDGYKIAFAKLKIRHVEHIHHDTHKELLKEDEGVLKRLKKADVVFFAGGDQLKYSFIYGGTNFLLELKDRYIHDKIVVAGTSAGAMVLSTPMIYAGNDEVQELGGMIKVTTGLEFLKDVCIDTHFVNRGRFVRMAQVVVTNPTCIGVGIEEDTAIIVRNGIDVEVVGTGTVIIIEGFGITEASIDDFTKKRAISIRDMKVHILSDDYKYQIPQINPPHV